MKKNMVTFTNLRIINGITGNECVWLYGWEKEKQFREFILTLDQRESIKTSIGIKQIYVLNILISDLV